jgi:hypothetical protein
MTVSGAAQLGRRLTLRSSAKSINGRTSLTYTSTSISTINMTNGDLSDSTSDGNTDTNSSFETFFTVRKLSDERELEFRYLRTLAETPPLLPYEKRKYKFLDYNRLVEDPVAVERQQKAENPWSSEEEEIFLKMYITFFQISDLFHTLDINYPPTTREIGIIS